MTYKTDDKARNLANKLLNFRKQQQNTVEKEEPETFPCAVCTAPTEIYNAKLKAYLCSIQCVREVHECMNLRRGDPVCGTMPTKSDIKYK